MKYTICIPCESIFEPLPISFNIQTNRNKIVRSWPALTIKKPLSFYENNYKMYKRIKKNEKTSQNQDNVPNIR